MINDPVLLYLHIPKAGGTTLNQCIYIQWRSDEYYVAEDNYLHAGIYYFPVGFFKELDLSMPENVRRCLGRGDIRAVVGHFWFGVHRYVTRPWTYVTLLRNPQDRILSLYYHLKMEGSIEITIDEFVKNPPYREVDNDQTRRISGLEPKVGQCTELTLEQAKYNLRQHFSIVGVTEHFAETLILLKRTFGWTKELFYYPQNVNPHRPSITSLSQKTLDLIMERNELDFQLYQFAHNLLDEAISSQGSSFREEVENFKLLNQEWLESIAARQSQQD